MEISIAQIADTSALTQQTNSDFPTIGLGTVLLGRGRGLRPATPNFRDNSRSLPLEYAIANSSEKLDDLNSRVIGMETRGQIR